MYDRIIVIHSCSNTGITNENQVLFGILFEGIYSPLSRFYFASVSRKPAENSRFLRKMHLSGIA